eukprot:4370068-Amphidinium_carterae.2
MDVFWTQLLLRQLLFTDEKLAVILLLKKECHGQMRFSKYQTTSKAPGLNIASCQVKAKFPAFWKPDQTCTCQHQDNMKHNLDEATEYQSACLRKHSGRDSTSAFARVGISPPAFLFVPSLLKHITIRAEKERVLCELN